MFWLQICQLCLLQSSRRRKRKAPSSCHHAEEASHRVNSVFLLTKKFAMPSKRAGRCLRQHEVSRDQLSLVSIFYQRQANTRYLAMSPYYARCRRLSSAAGSVSRSQTTTRMRLPGFESLTVLRQTIGYVLTRAFLVRLRSLRHVESQQIWQTSSTGHIESTAPQVSHF